MILKNHRKLLVTYRWCPVRYLQQNTFQWHKIDNEHRGMTTTPSYDTSFESNLLTTDPKQTRDMASMSDVSIYSVSSELIGSQFNMLEPLHFELFLSIDWTLQASCVVQTGLWLPLDFPSRPNCHPRNNRPQYKYPNAPPVPAQTRRRPTGSRFNVSAV